MSRASTSFLAALVLAAAATLYPYLIPPYPNSTGLTIFEATPSSLEVAVSAVVAIVGLVVLVLYSAFVRRRMSKKVRVQDEQANVEPRILGL